MADLQYKEGLTEQQKAQLVNRLDRINAGSAITDTDKSNFNYGLGSSWQSYLSPSVNYGDLGKVNTPVVPPPQTGTSPDAVIAGLSGMQNEQQRQLTAQQQQIENDRKYFNDIQMLQGVNPAETAYTTSVQGLQDLQTKEAGKTQALAEAYKSGGVEAYKKRLAELNQQAAQLQGSYMQGLTSVEGKVMPMQFITGQQAQMQKQYATRAAAIALEQQALQGNIENAKSIAKDMVDLEYGDIETQIKNQKDLINLNYDNLTRTEKKRADELSFILDQRQAKIDEEKATKKDINTILSEAITKGADSSTINKIKNSKTVADALTYASQFLREEKEGNWTIYEDAEGNEMMYDKNTGVIKPNTTTESQAYFTDANGTAWNIEGWAKDQTKAQQMQAIADRIGKVDDSNIDAKVKQFTPGLTADMIRNTSSKTGVSWEALMTMVAQEATGGLSNVAKNNNNFGGLTWSNNTQWQNPPYNGAKGTPRPEGGNYIKFPTKQAGLDAMGALMASYGTVKPQADTRISELAKAFSSAIDKGEAKVGEFKGATPKETAAVNSEVLKLRQQKGNIVQNPEVASNLNLANEILNSKYFNQVFGLKNPLTYWTPGTNEQYVKNQVNQLRSVLSLDNRQKLKGSGAISDFEAKTLAMASTALSPSLNDKDAKKELRKIRGVFTTASGGEAEVKITNPKTKESKTGLANRQMIEDAINAGYLVEY